MGGVFVHFLDIDIHFTEHNEAFGLTRFDKARNKDVQRATGVAPITHTMYEACLRRYDHVVRRNNISVARTGLCLSPTDAGPVDVPRRGGSRALKKTCDSQMSPLMAPPMIERSGDEHGDKRPLQPHGTNARTMMTMTQWC